MTENNNSIEASESNWWIFENNQKKIDQINKNYKIIYNIFFKYWIIILVIIIAAIFFYLWINKEKKLDISSQYDSQRTALISNYEKNTKEINQLENETTGLIIKIKQWNMDISENIIYSYENLLSYKGFTLPRWTFIYEPDKLQDKEHFNSSDYDLEELSNYINNVIFVDYDLIWSKTTEKNRTINLENNSIEETFYISCANRPRIFNSVCDQFIDQFLNWFFVYDISKDFKWLAKILKNLVWREKYKENVCKTLDKYIFYSNSAPEQLEDIAILCWGKYLDDYYMMQDFMNLKGELEEKYIKSNVSKYNEINEYKLVSYQQILYNNLEKWIPPQETMYKDYTNYLINLLKKISNSPISSFYYDTTYRFNNVYIIPTLNKMKYQSTTTKKDEIELIISDLEKINNWSTIDWYIWLKFTLMNKWLEEDIRSYWSNFLIDKESTMSILLKSIKNLSYMKLINDEITGNMLKINWYLAIDIAWITIPVYFWATLENINWNLYVKEIAVSEHTELNEILWKIIKENNYTMWEIYTYIQDNVRLYLSESYNITPCETIKNKLENLNIEWLDIMNCDENKILIIKWWSWNRILYQIKMNNYNIYSIVTTDKKIQEYFDKNLSWLQTSSVTIWNVIPTLISYTPEETGESTMLEWNRNAIVAIEDFKNYLWMVVSDIWERNGKAAVEFTVNDISFIWIYDTNTKKLWPLFLNEQWAEKEDIIFRNFSLYLTPDNQNEINKFLIKTIDYLSSVDRTLVNKYLSGRYETLNNK